MLNNTTLDEAVVEFMAKLEPLYCVTCGKLAEYLPTCFIRPFASNEAGAVQIVGACEEHKIEAVITLHEMVKSRPTLIRDMEKMK